MMPELSAENLLFRSEQSQQFSWEEAVAVGIELREGRDSYSFALGDWVLEVCGGRNPEGGRPVGETHTLSEYAKAIREDRSRLSGLMANSEFWPKPERDDLPPNVSWWHLSEARRRSGWRPGKPVTADQKAFALAFLDAYAGAAPPPASQDSRPTWARKLARAAALIGEVAADLDVPPLVRRVLESVLMKLEQYAVRIETV